LGDLPKSTLPRFMLKDYIEQTYGKIGDMAPEKKTQIFMGLYKELVETLERDHEPQIQVALNIIEKKCPTIPT
jgi:hypothetical protein